MKKAIFIISLAFVITGCRQEFYSLNGFIQGTTFRIVYQGSQDLKPEVDSLLHAFDLSLSTYNKESIITKINNNNSDIKVDKHFTKFYQISKEIWKATDGVFDISIAPIVNAWGFGFGDSAEVDRNLIDSLLRYVGMEKTTFENGKIKKQSPNIKFDSNAIAQGQSVDVVAAFLEKQGIINYLVEIGGEVKAQGVNAKSKTWRIGVDKPIDDTNATNRKLKAIIKLKNNALATSGNYRKFYIKDGVKYSHTINPKTGYPVNHSLLSATVIAPTCIIADAYATAFMVMGFDKTREFVGSRPELDVYLIADDGNGGYKIYISEGLKEYIEEL
ncbi:MAG: FAD:protein FMN transferase [Bacteroidota bacterium]|nr:FAD:protein FMN transferase [Bacteroidota bacterium]